MNPDCNDDYRTRWTSPLRQLRSAESPQRDLWPEIAARIAARPREPRWSGARAGLVASLAMAVGVGLLAQRAGWLSHPDHPTPTALQVNDAMQAPLAWRVPRDPRLAQAARTLDTANVELQRALQQHPEAVFLVGLLNRTNAQRMRLLDPPVRG